MVKRAIVNGFLLAAAAALWAAGGENRIEVRPTEQNYYLSTLAGESEHYAPTFYDDYLVSLDGKPVVQFTKAGGSPVDFYFFVTAPEDLDLAAKAFAQDKARLDAAAPGAAEALERYRRTRPSFPKGGLYEKVLSTVKEITSVAPHKIVGEDGMSAEIDAALYQYLVSNGIDDLSRLRERPVLIGMLVNKFYTLSTTYLFRDDPYVKAFLPSVPAFKARAEMEKRPVKVNVFACSTGEEVITYAIELLEAGVTDFTILGSDINEPGLRYAEEMRYSRVALERLPLETRAKVEKYFRLNETLGLWEPKDPAFFKARIRYIRQDILKDLPSDLDPRFAPPYDLVSIMNVLFYLDDAAVQGRKDSWARLVYPGGILVLHDFFYSVMGGTLGRDWAFRNFLPINEWVSVRADPQMTPEEKRAFYEKNFADHPSDGTFLSLLNAYMSTGQGEKGSHLRASYLQDHPRSIVALDAAWEYFNQKQDGESSRRILDRLLRIQPHSLDALAKLIASEVDRSEGMFLESLRRAQEKFMGGVKSRPKEAETAVDFREPSGDKYEYLRALAKTYDLGLLGSVYSSRKDEADAERVWEEGFRLAGEAVRKNPDVPALAQYLDTLAKDAMDHFAEKGRWDKVLDIRRRIRETFDGAFRGMDTFHLHALRGHLGLFEGMALAASGSPADARAALDGALSEFDLALNLLDEMMASQRPFFYGDVGRARMVRAELLVKMGAIDAARRDKERGLELLEKGLSYNPLYGKSMHAWREEFLSMKLPPENAVNVPVPLTGALFHFQDDYGPYRFRSEVIHYKSEDGADIEATQLTPEAKAPARPGLVFVHMWARDRKTWWGLPEFLASHGYPSIYMDLRGHGNSHFPGSDWKVTIDDDDVKKARYKDFPKDVYPAVERMLANSAVKDGRLVMIGASLGCPVGVIAAEKYKEKFLGMVMLSPSISYFGVDCRTALEEMKKTPLFVTAEKSDNSFRSAKDFFNTSDGYKMYLQLENVGHGTDALYRDCGLPTIILNWLEQLESVAPSIQKIRSSKEK